MTRTLFARLREARIGAFRHRLTIEAPLDVEDGTGGVTRSYVAGDSAWAAIEPLEADAASADRRDFSRLTHRIRLRWRADLDMSKRLRLGPRLFRILADADADERHRSLALLVEEERP